MSPLYDTTFKYLWKRDDVARCWFTKLIKYITTIDLNNYTLYDNEINSGNKLKDYRTDILFVEKPKSPRLGNTFNVEMYKNFNSSSLTKSYNYVFKLLSTALKEGEKYYEKQIVQVNFCDGSFKSDKKLGTICYLMAMMKDYIKKISLKSMRYIFKNTKVFVIMSLKKLMRCFLFSLRIVMKR